MNNNFYLTFFVSIILAVITAIILPFSILGIVCGILFAQIIEWFVHGWIQHHPFKIFKPYRDNQIYHHKHPSEPLSVQPVSYFLIGSVGLLAPFYWFNGFYFGYFLTYIFINLIHYDLHSDKRILPNFIWNTGYFRWITSHHEAHHKHIKLSYTTYSVTNPAIDVVFSKIKLNKLNNWIAKKLKI